MIIVACTINVLINFKIDLAALFDFVLLLDNTGYVMETHRLLLNFKW